MTAQHAVAHGDTGSSAQPERGEGAVASVSREKTGLTSPAGSRTVPGRLLAFLHWLSGWQPLTWRGLIVIALGTVALREYAIPQFDLAADILGKAMLALVGLTVVVAVVLRTVLARQLSIEIAPARTQLYSRTVAPLTAICSGMSSVPYFSITLQPRFVGGRVLTDDLVVQGSPLPDERQVAQLSSVFPHRGRWHLHAVRVSLRDALGLTHFRWDQPIARQVELNARPVDLEALPVLASVSRPGDLTELTRERTGDLFDLKQYDPSDGVRRILWKTYAKSGQLVVRRPEPAAVPEGEIALYMIAAPEDDRVAAATQAYADQLIGADTVIIFGTDGMTSGEGDDGAVGAQYIVENLSSAPIVEAINRCVWVRSAGTGEDFGSYMDAVSANHKSIAAAVVFGPSKGRWLETVRRAADARGIQLTAVLVDEAPGGVRALEPPPSFAERLKRFYRRAFKQGADTQPAAVSGMSGVQTLVAHATDRYI